MKLTVFSDLHDNFSVLKELKNRENLFFLGDIFTQEKFVEEFGKYLPKFYNKEIDKDKLYEQLFKHKEEIEKIAINHDKILDFFKENKMYILPGNHETRIYYKKLKKLNNLDNLHLKKKEINGTEFIGHGGMILPDKRINLDNYYIYTPEKVIENIKKLKPKKGCIILMHELPVQFYHKKIRKFFEKIKPKIVIGGHHHKLSRKTFVINNIKYQASGMKGEFIELEV